MNAKDIISYFKNKRVALIGPAPINENIGEKINNYDIICRVNEGYK